MPSTPIDRALRDDRLGFRHLARVLRHTEPGLAVGLAVSCPQQEESPITGIAELIGLLRCQVEAFVTYLLPWNLTWGAGWILDTTLNGSAGALNGGGDTEFIGTLTKAISTTWNGYFASAII